MTPSLQQVLVLALALAAPALAQVDDTSVIKLCRQEQIPDNSTDPHWGDFTCSVSGDHVHDELMLSFPVFLDSSPVDFVAFVSVQLTGYNSSSVHTMNIDAEGGKGYTTQLTLDNYGNSSTVTALVEVGMEQAVSLSIAVKGVQLGTSKDELDVTHHVAVIQVN